MTSQVPERFVSAKSRKDTRQALQHRSIPVAEKTYLFRVLYVETIIRNPKAGRSFRLQVGLRD